MITAIIAHMAAPLGPLAESDDGGMLQIIIVAIVMIASAIASVLKKRQEQSEGQTRPQPPAGSTSGTTVPSTARQVPRESRGPRPSTARPSPPVASAPPDDALQDRRTDRLEQMEQRRRQRASAIEREMLERAAQQRRESQARLDQARASTAAAQRMSQAAWMAEQPAAARAAEPLQPEGAMGRPDRDASAARPLAVSSRLKALLAEPSWRTAVITAEILGPPVGMRDPHQQAGTNPPAAWA